MPFWSNHQPQPTRTTTLTWKIATKTIIWVGPAVVVPGLRIFISWETCVCLSIDDCPTLYLLPYLCCTKMCMCIYGIHICMCIKCIIVGWHRSHNIFLGISHQQQRHERVTDGRWFLGLPVAFKLRTPQEAKRKSSKRQKKKRKKTKIIQKRIQNSYKRIEKFHKGLRSGHASLKKTCWTDWKKTAKSTAPALTTLEPQSSALRVTVPLWFRTLTHVRVFTILYEEDTQNILPQV